MRIVSRISDPPMTFFSLRAQGPHHDFPAMELGVHARRQTKTPEVSLTWRSTSGVQSRRSVSPEAGSTERDIQITCTRTSRRGVPRTAVREQTPISRSGPTDEIGCRNADRARSGKEALVASREDQLEVVDQPG